MSSGWFSHAMVSRKRSLGAWPFPPAGRRALPMSNLLMRRQNLENLPPMPALPEGFVLRACDHGEAVQLAALLDLAFENESWTAERAHQELLDPPDVVTTHVVAGDIMFVATASS